MKKRKPAKSSKKAVVKSSNKNSMVLDQGMMLRGDIFTTPAFNSTRQGFGDKLAEIGKENPNVVAVSADLEKSTKLDAFRKAFPDRFFEMGIAEQNMMDVAAGLALCGKIPFAASFAVFATGRAWDQLRTTIAFSKANVKVAATHTGVSVGPDGATAQSVSDIAVMRTLPNFIVLSPCDYEQAKKATQAAAEHDGPVYLRLGRPKIPLVTSETTPFKIGKADIYSQGKDVMIIATGEMVYQALVAAKDLNEDGISAGVINMHTIKPIDEDAIVKAGNCKLIITAEDHSVIGGLGSAVAEVLASEGCKARLVMVGVQDVFGTSGKEDELMREFHLMSSDIVEAAKRELG